MKNLSLVSAKEQKDFLQSFDEILCDIDGVLWLDLHPIPGSDIGIKYLQKIGKKIIFVSNNTMKTQDSYYNELKLAGAITDKEHLVTPIRAMIHYLQKNNFTKEIYLIGMAALKTDLINAGFKISSNNDQDLPKESLKDLAIQTCADNNNVGAVIIDVDVNINWAKLEQAKTFLKRSEVLFIAGAGEMATIVGQNNFLIGPGNFHKLLQEASGRIPAVMAKPGSYLRDFIMEKFEIKDYLRVLFIGDSIPVDMGFATKCGCIKLLVLSGISKREEVENWSFSEELKPDYYVEDMRSLHDIIEQVY